MSKYSLRTEKHVLGGLINNPEIFPEVERFIDENDFYNDVHKTIFCVVRETLQSNQELDKVILSQKISNLGISFNEDIEIYSYIKNISFTQIKPKAVIESSKQLLSLSVQRSKIEKHKKIISFLDRCGNESLDEIISTEDAIYNDGREYKLEDEPIDLFVDFEEYIEEKGNNPQSVGLETPYKEFNRLYGGLRPGEIYAIVSRPGQGKSTVISDLCFKTALINNVPILLLDTEMTSEDVRLRFAAALSDVEMYLIESGKFRKNKELLEKVREAIKRVKENKYAYYHCHVGNKNIDQICSIARRWKFSKVGRDNPCILAYDYIKLTGEKVGSNWAEYQAIGEKIDKLKRLAQEINAPLVTAMQLNRSGENFNRRSGNITDDSSAISLSDRLQWFASFVAIFRRKTLDEMAEDGEQFGTHKLIPLKSRFQGEGAPGHMDIIRREMHDGTERWTNNYLSFNVNKFNVEELGSLRTIIEAQEERHNLQDGSSNDGNIL